MSLTVRIVKHFLDNKWAAEEEQYHLCLDGIDVELVVFNERELIVRATNTRDPSRPVRTVEIDEVICVTENCSHSDEKPHRCTLFALRENSGERFGGQFESEAVERMIGQVERACRFTEAASQFGRFV